jgi:hypothetical protein
MSYLLSDLLKLSIEDRITIIEKLICSIRTNTKGDCQDLQELLTKLTCI